MKLLDNTEVCFVCRRRAEGMATGGLRRGWLCNDCGPQVGAKAYAMPSRQFDEYELRALDRAGARAGQYLDEIACTDLARLRPTEFRTFLALFLRTFGDGIRAEVARGMVVDGFGEPIRAHMTTEQLAELEQGDAA